MPALRLPAPVLALALLAATSCKANERPLTVTVFAAASLSAAFHALEHSFEAEHAGVDLVLNFAGSQVLAAQLLEGAEADLFASASPIQLERVADARSLDKRRTFASNTIVVVVPRGSTIASVEDLDDPGVDVVLAGEAVPAGRYTREALEVLGLRAAVEANVVSNETDVRGVIAKLALGEADAGLAYATDLAGHDALEARPLPLLDGAHAPVIRYELARLTDGDDAEAQRLASEFADYVTSPAGQAILSAHGFTPPPAP